MTTTQTKEATMATKYQLPVRVQFALDNSIVIAGTPGSTGEAGWSVVEFESRDRALHFMAERPQARMPCWGRIERGEC